MKSVVKIECKLQLAEISTAATYVGMVMWDWCCASSIWSILNWMVLSSNNPKPSRAMITAGMTTVRVIPMAKSLLDTL